MALLQLVPLPHMRWTLRNGARSKKGIVVGVTTSARERREDDAGQRRFPGYRHLQLARIVLVAAAQRAEVGPGGMFCWSVWTRGLYRARVYALTNRRLAAPEGRRGWRAPRNAVICAAQSYPRVSSYGLSSSAREPGPSTVTTSTCCCHMCS